MERMNILLRNLFCIAIAALAAMGCVTSQAMPQKTISIPITSNATPSEIRKSIIIYPAGFEESAKAFAYLHREFGGVEACLFPLTMIASGQMPGPELRRISFAGWDNQRPENVSIKGYDYLLAKKIIAYLNELQKRKKILAVLLLGDGGFISPSYYFHLPFLHNSKVDDKLYNEWIASDLFYGSPDLDLDLNWAVGRISVDTPEQAMRVAEKYYRWNLEKTNRKPDSFIFFSGNIKNDLVYSGELLYQMFEQERIVGNNASHYFQSDGRYTIGHLRTSFLQEPGNIHYIFTHGAGDGFEIDSDHLHSDEIAETPYKQGLPLVVSPSPV